MAKVAEAIGVAQSTVSMTQRHAAVLQRYPELGAPDVSRNLALKLAAAWDALTPRQRTWARKRWAREREQPPTATPDRAKQGAAKGKGRAARKRTPRRLPEPPKVPLTRTWFNFVAGLAQLITDFEQNGGVAVLLEVWTEDEWRRAQDQLTERREQLRRIADELRAGRERLGEPRPEGLRVVRGADA